MGKELGSIHHVTGNDEGNPQSAKRQRRSAKSRAREQSLPEISVAQYQAEHGRSPNPPGNKCPSRKSQGRLPPAPASAAQYQEWSFTGFLKRITIGDEMTYNLEFKLPPVPERYHLPVHSKVLRAFDFNKTSSKARRSRRARTCSLVSPVASSRPMKRVPWTEEEDRKLVEMKEKGCSWTQISAALRRRTCQTIQVRYSTKLKKRS